MSNQAPPTPGRRQGEKPAGKGKLATWIRGHKPEAAAGAGVVGVLAFVFWRSRSGSSSSPSATDLGQTQPTAGGVAYGDGSGYQTDPTSLLAGFFSDLSQLSSQEGDLSKSLKASNSAIARLQKTNKRQGGRITKEQKRINQQGKTIRNLRNKLQGKNKPKGKPPAKHHGQPGRHVQHNRAQHGQHASSGKHRK